MIITKCDKQCIFVNMISFCCLDDHESNTKHTKAQCERGIMSRTEYNQSLARAQREWRVK